MTTQGGRNKVLLYLWPILLIAGLLLLRFLTGQETSAGAKIYARHCANCHMEEGEGLGKLIPPLANSLYIQSHGEEMACMIREGIPVLSTTRRDRQLMPAKPELSAVELASLISYLKQNWGNNGQAVTARQVESALLDCESNHRQNR
ncbi:MAG: cytochrome c [Bacteroidota bacterium]